MIESLEFRRIKLFVDWIGVAREIPALIGPEDASSHIDPRHEHEDAMRCLERKHTLRPRFSVIDTLRSGFHLLREKR